MDKKNSYFIVILGLLFIIAGVAAFYIKQSNFNKFIETAIKTEGTISEIFRTSSSGPEGSRRGTNARFTVTFKTEDNKEIKATVRGGFINMHIGKPVDVYYDPANPNKVEVYSQLFSFLILFGLCGMGAITFIIGIIQLKNSRT
jgi:hypothetical protein